MTKLFTFDPADYAGVFASQEYVHIRQGLTEEFFDLILRQVEEYQRDNALGQKFALGNKRQALYQFSDDLDCLRQFLHAVGTICGLDPARLVIAERHIKAYDAKADPSPLAHKDRCATQVAVGFSVHVPSGSTLVLYPDADREPNPFQSSAELRAMLPADRLPEVTLRAARRVEIQDAPRDVMLFRGSSMWHLRCRPAGTVMLYFKLNAFNSDPLGEDPRTLEHNARTAALVEAGDGRVAAAVPVLGRRVDYCQRRFNHLGQNVFAVVLYGEQPIAISEQEYRALRAMDGRRSLREVAQLAGVALESLQASVRHLAAQGLVDLLEFRREPAKAGGWPCSWSAGHEWTPSGRG
jgi:hypothetical protein